jgi:SHS family lactate transporter-like MFS transporter
MPRHVYHRNCTAYPIDDSRQVQGLLIGVVAAFVIFITIIGPEYVFPLLCALSTSNFLCLLRNHGSHFENHKTAFEEGAARDDAMIEDVDASTESPDSKHSDPIEKA